jgi:hypothetical protein
MRPIKKFSSYGKLKLPCYGKHKLPR